MQIALERTDVRLQELVRLAESGEEVVLTRDGASVARLVVLDRPKRALSPEERRAILEEFRHAASAKASPGPSAARSQDFLYDEDGLPA